MRYSIIKTVLVLVSVFVIVIAETSAQNNPQKTIVVPLSNPDQPGIFSLDLISGKIHITTHERSNVVINAQKRELKTTTAFNNNDSLEFEVTENNNKVVVEMNESSIITDFEIKVPKKCSLNLRLLNYGDIYVEGVNGEFEISNENGKISLINISGSAIVDTINEDITVNFIEVANNPMAFSSLNGNLDITFPKNLQANIRAKADNGEVYTNLKIRKKPAISKTVHSNTNRINVEEWLEGVVNGGGSNISFKSLNGNITINTKN